MYTVFIYTVKNGLTIKKTRQLHLASQAKTAIKLFFSGVRERNGGGGAKFSELKFCC
jgi:hypothetical protein